MIAAAMVCYTFCMHIFCERTTDKSTAHFFTSFRATMRAIFSHTQKPLGLEPPSRV